MRILALLVLSARVVAAEDDVDDVDRTDFSDPALSPDTPQHPTESDTVTSVSLLTDSDSEFVQPPRTDTIHSQRSP